MGSGRCGRHTLDLRPFHLLRNAVCSLMRSKLRSCGKTTWAVCSASTSVCVPASPRWGRWGGGGFCRHGALCFSSYGAVRVVLRCSQDHADGLLFVPERRKQLPLTSSPSDATCWWSPARLIYHWSRKNKDTTQNLSEAMMMMIDTH